MKHEGRIWIWCSQRFVWPYRVEVRGTNVNQLLWGNIMNVLEIILLRSAAQPIDSLIAQLKESLGKLSGDEPLVTIYHREGLDMDLAVHIHRESNFEKGGTSQLGLRLASALEKYGLVQHTVWKELK